MLFKKDTAPGVIRNSKLTRNINFIKYFTLAMTYDHAIAEEKINWLDSCLNSWNSNQDNLVYSNLNRDEKYLFIQSIIEGIVNENWAELTINKPWVAFTSGLDARFLLYTLEKKGLQSNIFTFGQVGNHDYDLAQIYANRYDKSVKFYDTSEIQWSLNDHDRITNSVLDKPVSPRLITSVLIQQDYHSYKEVHGFINGRITGKLNESEGMNNWKLARKVFIKANDQFGFQRYLRPSLLKELLPDRPFPTVLDYYRQLDLGYRQFQRIRPVSISGLNYICPYTDEKWLSFWLNRSDSELSDQSLYKEMLCSLKADEFFDLNGLIELGLDLSNKNRRCYIYGEKEKKGRIALAGLEEKVPPLGADAHFCFYACYSNNKSFRDMVDKSISRIKNRNIFYGNFIDDVLRKFKEADKEAERMVKGIVSIDIAIESGVFNET